MRALSIFLLSASLFSANQARAQQPARSDAPPVIALPNQPPTPGVTGNLDGTRTHLAESGLTIAAGIYYDVSKNLIGGLNRSDLASRELFDLDITFTTDQLLKWHGGTFFINFLDHQGTNGSTKLVGDAQGFDNQDAPGNGQVYQLYFQQLFANDTLRFKIGRIDSTTDFAYVINGNAFLGSSFGYSPALSSFPTYPDPAPGVALFWTPNPNWYASAGISDANRSDHVGVLRGNPQIVRPTLNGEFIIAEIGRNWSIGSDHLAGRVAVGGYHHTGTFGRLTGGTQTGTSGAYAVLDQTVLQLSPDENVGIFAQYGCAYRDIATIDHHAGIGVQWTGPIPTKARSTDVLGLGGSYVHFSDRGQFTEDYELALEGFYKLQLTPWFNIQPDVQYILHPGGNSTRDAVVTTLRVELDF